MGIKEDGSTKALEYEMTEEEIEKLWLKLQNQNKHRRVVKIEFLSTKSTPTTGTAIYI